ncbi:MAG: response regulator [Hyphomicrobiales bacterium]
MEKQQRILLVDDNKVTVEGITSHLSRNYRVHTALTGLDALKVFEEYRKNLDLVITDMVMPDVSGGALISIIKAKSPVTPVIAMTGWGQHPSALAAEAKADVVLIKPFELEELDQSISKLLPSMPS